MEININREIFHYTNTMNLRQQHLGKTNDNSESLDCAGEKIRIMLEKIAYLLQDWALKMEC